MITKLEMPLFIFVALLWANLASAQVVAEPPISEIFNPLRDDISTKYEAGPALIYDCLDKHWVCGALIDHQECVTERDQNVKDGRMHLSCIPVQVYDTKTACLYNMQPLVARGNIPSACLHPIHRQRFIGFR